jgi:MFS transporter, PAT family, beta-lactamase induction signal transducer AmpG
MSASEKPGFASALSSWRVGAVALLSLSSGLPLGFVLRTVPQWLAKMGVDIKTIGLVTLSQAPYALKFLWAPLMDRYVPPLLGRKRGWILVTQIGLSLTMGTFAATAQTASIGFIAALTCLFAAISASQDIAVDGYAVESLAPTEQAAASGARTALYRAAMWVSGNVAISIGPALGWPLTFGGLALVFLCLIPVTVFAPEPSTPVSPLGSLRDALWLPFVGFLSRPRALEIAAFLFLYKMADNLAEALVSPFLTQLGYGDWDIGVGRGLATLISIPAGALVGGYCTDRWGIGRALWVFGVVQALSNVGYAVLATVPPSPVALYSATVVETFTGGLGTGAFGILTMRLTERRFSATQFALLSCIWGLGRTLSGPPAGLLADALGWRDFFLLSIPVAIPGLALLHRFAPLSQPQPNFDIVEEAPAPPPVLNRRIALAGVGAFAGGVGLATFTMLSLAAIKASRTATLPPFDVGSAFSKLIRPTTAGDAIDLATVVAFGLVLGLAVAATKAARAQRTP